MLLTTLLAAFVGVTLAGITLRWQAQRKRDEHERSMALAAARQWGVTPLAGESVEALRQRVVAVAGASATSDPIETAARALRAQREKREQKSAEATSPTRRQAG